MFLSIDKKDPRKTAAIDSAGRKCTYGDLVCFSRDLRKMIPGRELVMVLSQNDIPTLFLYLGCMINRIVPILIGNTMEKDAIKNLIEKYKPAYIAGQKELLEELKFEGGISLWEKEETILVHNTEERPVLYPELSLLLTTSGSTGSPKLVRHSYDNIEKQAGNIAAFFEMDGTERPMVDLPIMYTYGLSIVNSHLYAGATVLLSTESIMNKSFWTFFRENGATSFTGVPYSYELLKRLRFFHMDLPSLNMLSQGGGKLPEELQKEFAGYIMEKGGKYYATYGQTEGSARMAYLPPELALEKCGGIGKAIPNGCLYLMDEHGKRICQPGVQGEMYYEGPNVTLGYAENAKDLAKGDERNGILATGDIAYFDGDGCFYIVGRMKRFLKLYGYRVSLDECEMIIRSKYAVDCACTGNDRKLYICLTDQELEAEIREFLLSKTGLYAMAVETRIVDGIPKNPAGKTLYQTLNEKIGV